MSGSLRVTALVENTAGGRGTLGEHGLAFWIEYAGRHVLLDTGGGRTLADNARALDVDLARTDAIVLSHGHYDHSGGLVTALAFAPQAELYLHPAAAEEKYSVRPDGTTRSAGMPPEALKSIRQRQRDPVWTRGPVEVCDGMLATGPIPRTAAFEDTGGRFTLDRDGQQPDPLVDDQTLLVEVDSGTVVLLGCAHSGVVNTLSYVRELNGDRPIRAVIGGMHLLNASRTRVARTAEALTELKVPLVAPCHCTGAAGVVWLWEHLPGRCVPCFAGSTFTFE